MRLDESRGGGDPDPTVGSLWLTLLITVSLTLSATAPALNFTLCNGLVVVPGSGQGVWNPDGWRQHVRLLAPIVTGDVVQFTGRFDTTYVISGVLLLIGSVVVLTLTRRPIGEFQSSAAKSNPGDIGLIPPREKLSPGAIGGPGGRPSVRAFRGQGGSSRVRGPLHPTAAERPGPWLPPARWPGRSSIVPAAGLENCRIGPRRGERPRIAQTGRSRLRAPLGAPCFRSRRGAGSENREYCDFFTEPACP